MENRKKILEVSKLNKYFNKSGRLVKVLDNITFDVYEGDFLGIIGESGSGKSTTGKCIIRLYSSSSGNILFDNTIINQKKLPKKYKHWLYRNMSMIFQDPMSSLNPRKNILSLISEPLVINKTISNDTRKILKECYEINPYFHNTFKWQDYNLTKEYLLKFYEQNLTLFETTLKQLKATSNDLDGLTQMRDILIDLENNYKSSLLIYAEYVKYIKLLLDYNIKKYQLDELEKSEINYRHAKQNLNLEKKYTKAPKQYWDIKAIKDNLELKLKEFLAQNDFIYNEQNMSRLKSIKDKYSSEMKSLKQNGILTDSVTENIYERVNLQILKDTLKAMDKIDKDIYVNQDEIENFSNFINEKISEKYLPLIKTIHELGAINDELSQMSLQNTNEAIIKEKLANYNNIYVIIKQQLNQFKHSDPISENIDVANAVKLINEKSASVKRTLQFEKLAREDEIDKLKHELQIIKSKFNESNLKHINVDYYEAKHDLKIAKEYRKELDAQDRNYFKQNICPLIKQQNNTIESYIQKIYHLQKEIRKFSKHHANELRKKLVKNNKSNTQLKNNFDIIANEIAVKNDAINAINFEIDTYNQDVNLYRRIRKENWFSLYVNYRSLSQSLTRQYVYDVLNEVGLKNEHAYRYPHEFSGGQRQRIVIARALISKPKLVIADEPISALDVSIQAQVINIMKNLAKKYNITFLFIAHDLSMVRHTSNRLIILHKGKIVEKGNTEEVFNNPIHPYTKSLIKASPELSKIHVDLASFSSKLDYDKNYSPNNAPSFFQVENEQEHYVFATEEQFKRWTKL